MSPNRRATVLRYEPERLEFYVRASPNGRSGRRCPLYQIKTEVVNDARATAAGKQAPTTVISAYAAVDESRTYLEWCLQQPTRSHKGKPRPQFSLPVPNAPRSQEREDSGDRNLYTYINGAPASIMHTYLSHNARNPYYETAITRVEGNCEYSYPLVLERRANGPDVRTLKGIPRKHYHEDAWSSIRVECYRTWLCEPLADDPDAGWIEEEDYGEYDRATLYKAGKGQRHTHLITLGKPRKGANTKVHPWTNAELPSECDDDDFPYCSFVVYFKSMAKLVQLGIVPDQQDRASAEPHPYSDDEGDGGSPLQSSLIEETPPLPDPSPDPPASGEDMPPPKLESPTVKRERSSSPFSDLHSPKRPRIRGFGIRSNTLDPVDWSTVEDDNNVTMQKEQNGPRRPCKYHRELFEKLQVAGDHQALSGFLDSVGIRDRAFLTEYASWADEHAKEFWRGAQKEMEALSGLSLVQKVNTRSFLDKLKAHMASLPRRRTSTTYQQQMNASG